MENKKNLKHLTIINKKEKNISEEIKGLKKIKGINN